MRKIICSGLSLLVLLFCTTFAMAQSRTITGYVLSADGTPMNGVTVTVQNTARATITNDEGYYSIQAAAGEVLEFSFVGFATQAIAVGSSNSVSVTMATSGTNLDEVIVVGYGTQRRGNLTGAVTSVNVDETLGSRPIADAGRGLQGAVPGLSVRVPSGEVGSDPLMRIRGHIGSIQGSSQPLILVDNVEVPSIQLLNPNDIETITVLKDAAASSIYGAKAAFGVILITTKKGSRTEGATITYSNNFSWQNPAKKIDLAGIDGLDYALESHKNMKGTGPAGGFWRINDASFEKAKEWQRLYGGTVKYDDPVVYGRDWIWDGTDKYGYRIYDPAKAMVKEWVGSQNHNLSLNGRSNNTTYNIGVGYLDQEGMMKPAKHDDFKRLTANLKLSTKVTDFLTIRGGAMYSDRTKRYPNSTNSAGFGADPWLYLYRWSLLFPTGVKELGDELRDPYWDTKNSHTATLGNKYANFNLGTTIDITKNWNIEADYTFDTRQDREFSSLPALSAREPWYTPVAWVDENGDRVYVDSSGNITNDGGIPGFRFPMVNYVLQSNSYVYQSTFAAQRHTVNAFTTYNMRLNLAHTFKFMMGTNMVSQKWDSHWSRKTDLINNDNPQLPFGVGVETTGGSANWDAQVGYFGRVNYDFRNKYLLEANIRYDGSSKFPERLRWRWFPSFSAGWVITNENFMESAKDILSFAKLRASWGSIGDQSVGNALYVPTMGISKNSWLNSSGQQFFQLGTPAAVSDNIMWQDIETLNFGVDLKFFRNKFGVVFDIFERNTNNMIIAGQALPATFGTGAPQSNLGFLKTRGWELVLDFNHRFANGLGINLMGNLSDSYTDITKAADWNIPWEDRIIDNTFTTGKRYGDIYGYVTDRLYQKDDFVYDADGNFIQETIVWRGNAKVTNKLAGNNPVYQTYFEDGNQVLLISPGDVKFVDVDGDGYITPGRGTFGDPGDRVVIGNSLPRYEYGFRVGVDYKGFDFSVMGQGVGKRAIWGAGSLAIPGFHAKDGGMPQAIAGDFWKADRTDAFYPRAWNLNGANSGYVMVPQTRYILNMAYFRIKNITLGYNFSPQLLNNINLKQARLYVSLENFITFDKLRGLPIDPEAISGYSMLADNYNLGRTGTSVPVFKIASVGLNITL